MCEFEYNYHYVMVLEQVGIVRSLWLKILLSFCIKFCENTNECVCPYGDTVVCRLLETRKPTIKLLGDMLHHSPFSGDFMQIVPRAFHFCSKIKACVSETCCCPLSNSFFFSNWTNHCGIKPHKTCEIFPKKKFTCL